MLLMMGFLAERLSDQCWPPGEVLAEAMRIAADVLTLCTPRAIYLFGSAAEGRFRGTSDFDFLLTFDSVAEAKAARRGILSHPPFSSFPVDWLFFDHPTFERKSRIGGVCFDAVKYGILLYPR